MKPKSGPEFIQVKNSFIKRLYNKKRTKFRKLTFSKEEEKKTTFQDKYEFSLLKKAKNLENDYFKEEEKIPNFYRNKFNEKEFNKRNWKKLEGDVIFQNKSNCICLDCFAKGDRILNKKFSNFDRTINSKKWMWKKRNRSEKKCEEKFIVQNAKALIKKFFKDKNFGNLIQKNSFDEVEKLAKVHRLQSGRKIFKRGNSKGKKKFFLKKGNSKKKLMRNSTRFSSVSSRPNSSYKSLRDFEGGNYYSRSRSSLVKRRPESRKEFFM